MKILGKELLEAYPNRIINLHPSLLPKFPGAHSIEEFYNSYEKETGITIHLVDKGVDTGPIIFQKKISRQEKDSLEDLTEKIHELEHRYYPKIIAEFIRENVAE
jgi:phosphoribosylglycinamide formyltransferase-1